MSRIESKVINLANQMKIHNFHFCKRVTTRNRVN